MPVAKIILLIIVATDVYFVVRANALKKEWHLHKKPLSIIEEQRCIGIFSRIAEDLNALYTTKKSLLHHVTKYDENLIEAAIRTRERMFDFECINKLKNCVLKVANCNAMRPNHPVKTCTKKRQPEEQWVCNSHKQVFENDKLNLLTCILSPDLKKTNMEINSYFKDVVDLSAEVTPKQCKQHLEQFYSDWFAYTKTDVFSFYEDIDDLSEDFVKCFFIVQALVSVD